MSGKSSFTGHTVISCCFFLATHVSLDSGVMNCIEIDLQDYRDGYVEMLRRQRTP